MEGHWKSQWESMTVDQLFALRNQIQQVLGAKLAAKKLELERRLQQLNQARRVTKPDLSTVLMVFGHCGCAWNFLPLVSNL
jgi:hypothetical protein